VAGAIADSNVTEEVSAGHPPVWCGQQAAVDEFAGLGLSVWACRVHGRAIQIDGVGDVPFKEVTLIFDRDGSLWGSSAEARASGPAAKLHRALYERCRFLGTHQETTQDGRRRLTVAMGGAGFRPAGRARPTCCQRTAKKWYHTTSNVK